MRTRTIIVAARKRDPKASGVQKYSNNAAWNVPGGRAPNGVSATRYLRDTTPDLTKLTSPLAVWLVITVPKYCAGKMPSAIEEHRVLCYNGRTMAEQYMHEAETLTGIFTGSTPEDAKERAKAILEGYAGYLDGPQQFDWCFDIIEPNQTDEDYWNLQAERIVASGTVRITIGKSEWQELCLTRPQYAVFKKDLPKSPT